MAASPENRVYMQRAADRSRETRRLRVQRLATQFPHYEVARLEINRLATSNDHRRVYLRHRFITLPMLTPEQEAGLAVPTKPPMGELVHRHPFALRLYLTLLFIGHYTRGPGGDASDVWHDVRLAGHGTKDSYSLQALLGDAGVSLRAHRLRIQRALCVLEDFKLVELEPSGARGRYERFVLLQEDASGTPYRVPGGSVSDPYHMPAPPTTTGVTSSFFTNLWYLVLEPLEIANLLVLMQARVRFRGGHTDERLFLPPATRQRYYGISDEAYETHRELEEFGLLSLRDPIQGARHRGRTKLPKAQLVPYEFELSPSLMNLAYAPQHVLYRLNRWHAFYVDVDPAPHLSVRGRTEPF